MSTHFAWRCVSEAKSEKTSSRGPELAVDPARVDAVLRADLEHTGAAKALGLDDTAQRLGEQREVGELLRRSRRTVVADRPRILDVLRELVQAREALGVRLVHLQPEPHCGRPGRTPQ